MATQDLTGSVEKAQRLRLQRMLWGFCSQFCSLVIVAGLYGFGMLPGPRVLEYCLLILLIDALFLTLLRTGLNLRFRDPSMTAAQIIVPLWPAIYIMYFIDEPQVRTAFLLMATGGLLFGMFALGRQGMLAVGGVILLAYLILLAALQGWAPQRIDLRVEAIIVFAYGAVLVMVAYIGGFIAEMRRKLKVKNRELEVFASYDALTQLPNRRTVLERLAQEAARVDRRSSNRSALCIAMLDIDDFKRINDTWGHDVGDAVLSDIGELLRRTMRQGDFVGRFGGEEFILVLPETTLEGAAASCERIRRVIAESHFPDLPEGEQVTVSLGLARYRPGETVRLTVKRADDAVYKAKSEGRDSLVICDNESRLRAVPES